MKKLLLFFTIIYLSILNISCNSESEEKVTIIDIPYFVSLYGKTYNQLKHSYIGVIREESEVYIDDGSILKGLAVVSDIKVEDIDFVASFYVFNDKVNHVLLRHLHTSNAECMDVYRKMTDKAVSYWGEPTEIYYHLNPSSFQSTYTNFWTEVNIEDNPCIQMNYEYNKLTIVYNYSHSSQEIPSSIDIDIIGE